MAKDEESCCERMNEFLYSLCAECGVVLLVFIDFLAITAELLIRFKVVQDPNSSDESQQLAATSKNITDMTDPGGGVCKTCSSFSSPIDIAYCLTHYISIVISGLFFIEVVLRFMSGRSRLCKDYVQVFDSFVVILLVTMEILFTVFWTEVLCTHKAAEAATYIVLLRLCRIPRACSVSKEVYADKVDIEIHYLRKEKRRVDKENSALASTVDIQQREIESLKNAVRTSAELGELERRGSSDLCNGHISDGIEKSSTERSLVSRSEKGTYAHSRHNSKQNGNKDDGKNNIAPPGVSVTVIQTTYQNVAENNVKNRNRSSSVSETQFNTDVQNETGNTTGSVHVEVSGTKVNESDVKTELKAPSKEETEKKKLQRSRSDSALSSESVTKIVIRQLDKAIDEGSNPRITRGVDNKSFLLDEETEKVQMRNLPVMAEYEGTRTYRSAEGVPLTDL